MPAFSLNSDNDLEIFGGDYGNVLEVWWFKRVQNTVYNCKKRASARGMIKEKLQ